MTVINSYASDEIFCQVTTKIHLFKPQYLLKNKCEASPTGNSQKVSNLPTNHLINPCPINWLNIRLLLRKHSLIWTDIC